MIYNPDQDWEQTGIIPDLDIPGRWDEFTFDSDPMIQATQEYLDQNRQLLFTPKEKTD